MVVPSYFIKKKTFISYLLVLPNTTYETEILSIKKPEENLHSIISYYLKERKNNNFQIYISIILILLILVQYSHIYITYRYFYNVILRVVWLWPIDVKIRKPEIFGMWISFICVIKYAWLNYIYLYSGFQSIIPGILNRCDIYISTEIKYPNELSMISMSFIRKYTKVSEILIWLLNTIWIILLPPTVYILTFTWEKLYYCS